MEALIKLESINCWAGSMGIMNCDDAGLPIMEESRSWASLDNEFYLHLSAEDKEKINQIINKNNKD